MLVRIFKHERERERKRERHGVGESSDVAFVFAKLEKFSHLNFPGITLL
jgi:hypothetical protein